MSTSPDTMTALLTRNYALTHERLLKAAEELDAATFAKSAGPAVHSVAWQLWHVARWDDRFAEILAERCATLPDALRGRRQVWIEQDVASGWGLQQGTMGVRDTGTQLDDADAERVDFPPQARVIRYAKAAFGSLEELLAGLDDDTMSSVVSGDPDGDSYGQNVVIYLEHAARHLGMIEAIRGIHGGPGTVTR
jgi:DinB superfamily